MIVFFQRSNKYNKNKTQYIPQMNGLGGKHWGLVYNTVDSDKSNRRVIKEVESQKILEEGVAMDSVSRRRE